MILKPRPYQLQAIEAVVQAWKEGTLRPAVVLPTGAGKGHPLDTEVPTPQGLRRWGDLVKGDQVFGSDGKPTEVTEIYDRGVQDIYRVTLSDGSSVETDGDHLWQVRDMKYRKTKRERTVKSTKEMFSEPKKLGHGGGYRFRIPVTEAVLRPWTDLPIEPYTLGSMLANGSTVNGALQLTTPDDEVIARVRKHHTATKINDATPGVCLRYWLPELRKPIAEMGLDVYSREKFIPRRYLEASVPQRVALLQGLMDGDGSTRAGSGRRSVLFHSTAQGLLDGVQELVTSLGGNASVSWSDRSDGKSCGTVHILLPSSFHPFSTSRKGAQPQSTRNLQPRRAIVSIELVRRDVSRCITVAAPDHLYLITRNHIVTHNTVTFAHLVKDHGTKSLVLVHRDELARQAMDKVRSVAPDLNVGLVKAESNETDADVIVASVQTLVNPDRLSQISGVDLVVVDEAHHAAAPSYKTVLQGLGSWSGTRTVGFTATMSRSDDLGLGDVWEDVVFHKDIMWGIINGLLVDVEAQTLESDGLDLASVARSRGDYQEGQLGEALEASGAGPVIAKAYKDHAGNRQGVLFTPTVSTAESFAQDFRDQGISTEVVTGSTPVQERQEIFNRYQERETQVLANCSVLTEGWDMPQAEVAVIARPTQSRSLFIQMAGRVLRPFPGKEKALILVVVGLRSASLRSIVDLSETEIEPKKGKTLREMYELDIEEEVRVERDVLEGRTTTKVRKL